MKRSRGDREVFGVGTIVFTLIAVALAFAALVTAADARSRSSDLQKKVSKLESSGVVGSTINVTLEEFTMIPHPSFAKSGPVTFNVDNVGSITHEMVLVRVPNPAALPRVKKAGERAVGDVNEEAISEANTIGETGDVPPRTHVTKTFTLTPGAYVMFCNIDDKNADGTALNHFRKGMVATITVI